MSDYPPAITTVNQVEPVPRRIRAFLGGQKVLDTTQALYVWEWPNYPQYYIPLADVRQELLVAEGHTQQTGRGLVELRGLRGWTNTCSSSSNHESIAAQSKRTVPLSPAMGDSARTRAARGRCRSPTRSPCSATTPRPVC